MLRGTDVDEVMELKRQGLSVRAISRLTGYDRKTINRYLAEPSSRPVYGPRVAAPSKLESHKGYLKERLRAGVWNAAVLLRELRERNYSGGYTILKDWLHPQRTAASAAAVRRFETPPGKQAQVDWGHLGYLEIDGRSHQVWGVHNHARVQPPIMGRGGLGPETGDVAADARSRFPGLGRGAGGDPIRSHENGLARHR